MVNVCRVYGEYELIDLPRGLVQSRPPASSVVRQTPYMDPFDLPGPSGVLFVKPQTKITREIRMIGKELAGVTAGQLELEHASTVDGDQFRDFR